MCITKVIERRLGLARCVGLTMGLSLGAMLLQEDGKGAEPKVTVEAVAKAWERYQKSIHSARLEWKDRVFIPKETVKLPAQVGERALPGDAKERLLPLQDETLEGVMTFILDGAQWRFSSQSHMLDRETGKFKAQKSDVVSSRGIIKSLMPPGGRDYPIGNINNGKPSDIPRVDTARPPFLILRSLSVDLITPSDYRVVDRVGEVDGNSCVILEKGPASAKFALWVDPLRDYLIVRETMRSDGKELETATFTYAQGSGGLWIPTGWRSVEVGLDGLLQQSLTAVVSRSEINVRIDPSELALEFPPGTLVRDYTRPSELGDNTRYIVREDGTKRLIDRRDQGAPYERLLATETGQANLSNRVGHFRKWTIFLVIVGVVGTMAILVGRKWWSLRSK